MHTRACSLALRCAAAIALSASTAAAQTVRTARPVAPFLVVANQRTDAATIVELASGRVTHVELGVTPHEVAVSPDGRLAVLTNPFGRIGSNRNLVVLDLATMRVARRVRLRDHEAPHGVAFVSDSVVLVGALEGTSLAYVNVRNGRVLRGVSGIPEHPYLIALAATGRAYASSPHSSEVTEVDVATGRVLRTIGIPDDPAGIAVSPDGRELFAAVWREPVGGGIAIVDLGDGRISRLPASQPRRMAVTADGRRVVVSDRDHLRIVDRATRQVRLVALGADAGASGVACAPDATRCYVALSRGGQIVEVDLGAARVTRRFAARRGLDGVAYVPR